MRGAVAHSLPTSIVRFRKFCIRQLRLKMSWTCHGANNEELVNNLRDKHLVQSERAVEAMKATDRSLFCLDRESAYIDAPQSIGFNATISAPHMHAMCIELLKDHLIPGSKVLDIGSGSGYLTAIMANMVRDENCQGQAIGIEHIPELAERSQAAARQIPYANRMLQEGTLTFLEGDGHNGWQKAAPYNAIHVGAAASTIPEPLIQQLSAGGRMVLPVGPELETQVLRVIDKDQDGFLREHDACGVRYVPLTSRHKQLKERI